MILATSIGKSSQYCDQVSISIDTMKCTADT